jgi:drug/metabolite transporter (DMT)-like permease
MTGSQPRHASIRTRSRHWAAVACVGLALVSAYALSHQHLAFGALAAIGALLLFKDSALNPRHQRSAHASPGAVAPQTVLATRHARRALRKAA